MTAKFGPKDLKIVRQRVVDSGHSRRDVNDNINRVRRIFKWAVENELIPVAAYQALAAVSGSTKRMNGSPGNEACAARRSRHSCRPGKVCVMRPCDVTCEDEVWLTGP